MKISIITPSRKRPKYLLESFESFISKAKNNKDIQYIGVIDDDDMETKEYKDDILKMGKKYDVNIELYETPRIPLEQYLNTGATVATGDVLFFIADDVFCDKNGWDTLMSEACEKYLDEPFLIWTVGKNESWKPFPTHFGLSRKWVDIAEMVTCHRSSDEFVKDIAELANLRTIKMLDWYIHRQRQFGGKKRLEGALEFDETAQEMYHGYDGRKPSMSIKNPKGHLDFDEVSGTISTKELFEDIAEKLKNWKSYD
jgi:glycosyltransferase involved in cell wall biosynthesis